MNSNPCKSALALGALTLGVGLASVGSLAQTNAPKSSTAPKLSEQEFKNIQVLKGIPADQLRPTMQFITASLGVDCEYCHVREGQGLAFDKDDKKQKVTARKMMKMMFAINKENFDGQREVTCYSCHRGAAEPVGTPILADEESTPDAEPEKKPADANAALPSAELLLEKHLAAVGGVDALQKISSRVEKGTLAAFGGRHFPIEIFAKAPHKRISIMRLPDGESITAFDGHQGWLSFPGHTQMMTEAENNAAGIDADMQIAAHLKTLYRKFSVAPGEKIDGHDTYLVLGQNEDQPPLRLYLDQQTGLLLRLVRYAETALGRNPTQIDYADYRDADGVKIPFRWTLSRPGNRFTIQIDQVQQNIPVDDSRFAPPPIPPTSGQKQSMH